MKDFAKNEINRLINNLFVGILFEYILKHTINYYIIVDKDLTCPFIYYFIGIVISRIGSVVIEPVLKLTRFLKFANYGQYVEASKEDAKIELFARMSEGYRTIGSVFVTSLFLMLLEHFYSVQKSLPYIFLAVLVLFMYSYRKQASYVSKRVENFMRKKK